MRDRLGPLQRHGLPTLTEVVELEPVGDAGADVPARAGQRHAGASLDPAQLVERVLRDLQRDADLMLELRLREAVAPVLARLADELVHELRGKLEAALRDAVTQAASRELARRSAA